MESTMSTGKAAKLLGIQDPVLYPIIADRWYPSGRLYSICGWKSEALTENGCMLNAVRATTATSINLKRLATETALPVASPTSNGGAASGTIPAVVGKVTPVRYDGSQQDTSGQEENRAHLCALS